MLDSPKKTLRQQVRLDMKKMSETDYLEKSRRICSHLESMTLWDEVSTIHLYWPLLDRREPDIRRFNSILMSRGITIVMPVVRIFSRKGSDRPRLQHAILEKDSALVENRWGISEPVSGKLVTLDKIEVVVVPAVAVDRSGRRLGNGFGYYDEFLRDLVVPLVCPIFEKACLERIPEEPHDVRMTYIVTERGVSKVN